MTRTFSKSLVTQLAAIVLMSFALAPVAEAARDGGGRGGGGGGQARASAGTRQVDNSRADARTNNVRSTSVNNVNTNRNTNVNASRNTNVNVNVNNNGGWDNDYHPVAGAMAVGAAIAVTSAIIGSTVATVPPGCVPVNYGGMVYQQCGGTWYQPQGSQFIVVNPPY
jgi:hypothetical protein